MEVQTAVNEREVTWQVDGIPVYGTLSKPSGSGPFPGMVFVAGSGPYRPRLDDAPSSRRQRQRQITGPCPHE